MSDTGRENIAIRTTWMSILSNAGLALAKFLAGIFGNSFALIADAIESTSDTFASILVLLGFKYARRPADANHPYGHGKIEPLVTFLVVAFLVVSAATIAVESVRNIKDPHEAPAPWTLIVLGVIIIWKEISFRIVIRRSKLTQSTSLMADAWHHRSDAITSVLAFVGILIAWIMGEGYESADDWAALVASFIILYNSYLIFRPALGEIMDENRYDDLIAAIRQKSIEVKGVLGTEKCYIRKAGMRYYVDLHAMVNGEISVKEGHRISHELKDALMQAFPSLANVMIHIESDQ